MWNALDESSAFGKAAKQGMESIIKLYTRGNYLLAVSSSVVGEVTVDSVGLWAHLFWMN